MTSGSSGPARTSIRKILNAGVGLTAAVAIFSYLVNVDLSRAYVLIALPGVTLLDLIARYRMRKRLHNTATPAAACSAWWRSAMSRPWPTWSRNSDATSITG